MAKRPCPLPEDLSAFFRRYAQAWNTQSAQRIANHYVLPASILDGAGLASYSDSESLTRKFVHGCERFRELGYTSAGFTCEHHVPVDLNTCFVNLTWKVELNDATSLTFGTAYTLRMFDRSWRILSAVVYEKPERSGA